MFKKLISVSLAIIMVFAMTVPCFAANEEYPTIYVTGAQTNNLFSAEGERIYPIGADVGAIFKEAIGPCIEQLLMGYLKGDYSDYTKELQSHIAPVFEKVKLDVNGEATDGSRPEYHSSTVAVSNKQSGYGMWDYRFWYDWRLSPLETAAELEKYIDRVKEATGKDKVNLVGRCYGANVIQTYLTLHETHALANVSDVAYYASSVMGIDFMSALFSGEIALDSKAVENFAEYYLEREKIISDPTTEVLIITLVEFLNQAKILGIGTDALMSIVNELKDAIIPAIVMEVVGSWPSYWSMVTPELYIKSRDYIFDGREDEYANFIAKTDKYYYDVGLKAEETILALEKKGINFYIFSKYGFPEIPLHKDARLQSDSYTTVYRQSFGATTAEYGKVLSDKYINGIADKKYLSPDLKIDASTALLPQRSWFVKNLHHNDFAVLHDLTLEIMRYDLTVDSTKYPQYLYSTGNAVEILEGPDEDATTPEAPPQVTYIRFFTAIINFFTKLFRGELNLKEIFSGLFD